MQYLKTDKGWKCLENGQIIEFGEIVLNTNRFYGLKFGAKASDKDYNNERAKLVADFGEEIANEIIDSITIFRGIVEDCVFDEDYAKPIIDFKIIDSIRTSREEQIKRHKDTVELVRKQGWVDFPENKDVSLLTRYLLACADTSKENNFLPLKAYPHFIDNKWVFSYEVQGNELLFLDLIAMQEKELELAFCKVCDTPFVKKKKNHVCCSAKCQNNRNGKGRKNTPGGKKHLIVNYMRNSSKFTEQEINQFLQEFEEKKNILYREELIAWLEAKHQELKAI